jgi:hypothetical protein
LVVVAVAEWVLLGEDLVLPVIQRAAVVVGLLEYIILGQAMGAVQLAVMAVE